MNGRIIGVQTDLYSLGNRIGLWLLDQHIVHERILYERLLAEEPQFNVQQVFPITLNFSHKDAQTIVEHLPKLARLGLELEEFGINSFVLREYPVLSAESGSIDEAFIIELVDDLLDEQTGAKAVITLACKSAIKAGRRLDNKQIQSLLEQLAAAENPLHAPMGGQS